MRQLAILTLLSLTIACDGQQTQEKGLTTVNFDSQILNYQPTHGDGVHQDKINEAFRLLAEIKGRIKKNKSLDRADYWNLLVVFNDLQKSKENVDVVFEKFVNSEGKCEYLESFQPFFEKFNARLEQKLENQLETCTDDSSSKKEKKSNPRNYARSKGLNENLVEEIHLIGIDDQKDRFKPEIQNPLDIKNQKKIDALYAKHKTYIGVSLVGDKYKSVMWQVIQHSNLNYMEKYLPVVVVAVEEKELGPGALKYLIDRIYTEKYNYQIFGSQQNIKLAKEATRNQVKKEFKID